MLVSEKPLLALSIGDPSGVGPEIVVKALQTRELQERMQVLLLGNRDGIEHAAAHAGCNLNGGGL